MGVAIIMCLQTLFCDSADVNTHSCAFAPPEVPLQGLQPVTPQGPIPTLPRPTDSEDKQRDIVTM